MRSCHQEVRCSQLKSDQLGADEHGPFMRLFHGEVEWMARRKEASSGGTERGWERRSRSKRRAFHVGGMVRMAHLVRMVSMADTGLQAYNSSTASSIAVSVKRCDGAATDDVCGSKSDSSEGMYCSRAMSREQRCCVVDRCRLCCHRGLLVCLHSDSAC